MRHSLLKEFKVDHKNDQEEEQQANLHRRSSKGGEGLNAEQARTISTLEGGLDLIIT